MFSMEELVRLPVLPYTGSRRNAANRTGNVREPRRIRSGFGYVVQRVVDFGTEGGEKGLVGRVQGEWVTLPPLTMSISLSVSSIGTSRWCVPRCFSCPAATLHRYDQDNAGSAPAALF